MKKSQCFFGGSIGMNGSKCLFSVFSLDSRDLFLYLNFVFKHSQPI